MKSTYHLHVNLDVEIAKRFEDYVIANDRTRTKVVSRAIEEYLEKHKIQEYNHDLQP